jgi:hypothetical protein
MAILNYIFAAVPLLLPGWYLFDLMDDPVITAQRWLDWSSSSAAATSSFKDSASSAPPASFQLLAYVGMSIFGFFLTNQLVPHIKEYTLRKGICGKDLGKRGTPLAEKPV